MALELIKTDTVLDDPILELNGAEGVATLSVGGKTFVAITGRVDDGVSLFAVDGDGTLTNVANVTDTPLFALDQASGVVAVEVAGTTFLFVAGDEDDGVSVFAVHPDGTLVNVETVEDAGVLELNGPQSVASATFGGTKYLIVGGFFDDGVSVFSVGADGSLTNVDNVDDAAHVDHQLVGVTDVTTAVVNGSVYLFAAGQFDNGVSVFNVAPDGTLTHVDSVDDGDDPAFEIEGAVDITTAKIGGSTYLFVAGTFDNGISVFSVAADGTLTNVDNVDNADDPDLELALVDGLSTAVVDGVTYLFATGGILSQSVNIFSVAEDGVLTYLANIGADEEPALAGAGSTTTTVIDGVPYLFAPTSGGNNGVSVFRLEHDGVTLKGTNAGETLTGTEWDDTLLGKKGNDKLKGLEGDDLLDGGKGKDKLIGGDDVDTFRFSAGVKKKHADTIKDFEVGVDTIALDSAVFTKLGGPGGLKSKFFDLGKKADSGKDRILYQEDKGWLRYDFDGKGGADAVKFAKIGKNLGLSADDFMVV
ncbi:hypothetical protein [Bauldia sp.]|uniref:hypothetical protein n=1 Tax=Bauldia sp. TaxID=2575872 RepID=UPI003BAADD49